MINNSSDRLADELTEWIASAAPGAQLPSTRQLVARHGVSPVTVQQALRRLTLHGLIESRPGVGTFVREVRQAKPNDYGWQTAALGSAHRGLAGVPSALRTVSPDVIPLHSGYPDRSLLPERLVRSAFVRMSRSEAVVARPPAAGDPELKAWFAGELGKVMHAGLMAPIANDVVILPGSQSGLSILFRALAGPSGALLVESPTYWGALLAAAQVGVQLVPVPSGPEGPDPDVVRRAFRQSGARAFYAQPTFANPTGAQWSGERLEGILGVVRDHGAFLIEDDWAHDFAIDSEVTPAAARDDGGHVVYLRSLTKSVSPSVRVAGMVVRGPARERVLAEAQAQSMFVSGALQAVALDVVTQPAWGAHIRALRHDLRSRRDLLVAAVRDHMPSAYLELVPRGGLNLWVRLDDGVDLRELTRDCEARGVTVAAGSEWFPAEPAGQYVRLNYAGPNPGGFPDAARTIGAVLAAGV